MNRRRFAGFLCSVVIVFFLFSLSPSPPVSQTEPVQRVVDGDTVLLASGEYVRLLGIDTPERGQLLYAEAKALLQSLVEGRNVTLEKDTTNRDKYHRLLRSLLINGTLVNLQLVEAGLARTLFIGPDRKHATALTAAAEQAKGRGVWNMTDGQWCVYIRQFTVNPSGADEKNLNGEKVVLRNKCTQTIALDSWTLENSAGKTFILPNTSIQPKKLLSVRSGNGTDNSTDVFLGSPLPVWKNKGEAATLRDGDGRLVGRYERA